MIVGDAQTSKETFWKQQDIEIGENKNISFSSGSKNPEQFRQFDMVDDCLDHHFVNDARRGLTTCQVRRVAQ